MACFAVPLASAVLLFAAGKFLRKESSSLRLLELMLAGGAVMLVIDHLWNNELFLFSGNLAMDLLLGVLMALGATVFWGILVLSGKTMVPAIEKAKN